MSRPYEPPSYSQIVELPSGKFASLRDVQLAMHDKGSALEGRNESLFIKYFGDPNRWVFDGAEDVAALREALSRISTKVEAPARPMKLV